MQQSQFTNASLQTSIVHDSTLHRVLLITSAFSPNSHHTNDLFTLQHSCDSVMKGTQPAGLEYFHLRLHYMCICSVAIGPSLDLSFILLLNNKRTECHLFATCSERSITACNARCCMLLSLPTLTEPCQTTSSKWPKITQYGSVHLHLHISQCHTDCAGPIWHRFLLSCKQGTRQYVCMCWHGCASYQGYINIQLVRSAYSETKGHY